MNYSPDLLVEHLLVERDCLVEHFFRKFYKTAWLSTFFRPKFDQTTFYLGTFFGTRFCKRLSNCAVFGLTDKLFWLNIPFFLFEVVN